MFYLMISHFNSFFVLIFALTSLSDPNHSGIPARVAMRGETHAKIILLMGAVRVSSGFHLPLSAPRKKSLCRFQMPSIIEFIVMLETAVVDVDVVGLSYITALYHAIALDLYPTPIPISIHPAHNIGKLF